MDWVKEYEEETGFSAYEFGGVPKRAYVEWLEEELDLKVKAGQHETVVNCGCKYQKYLEAQDTDGTKAV